MNSIIEHEGKKDIDTFSYEIAKSIENNRLVEQLTKEILDLNLEISSQNRKIIRLQNKIKNNRL